MKDKYEIPVEALNKVSTSPTLSKETRDFVMKISDMIDEFADKHDGDPALKLFLLLRTMNMTSAKASALVQFFNNDPDTSGYAGMSAGVQIFQHMAEILQRGIQKQTQ